jgi:hypothetical protein
MAANLTGAMSHVQRADAPRANDPAVFDIGVRRDNLNRDGSTVGCKPRAV